MRPRGFTADVSAETLRVTTGLDRPGHVNLEKSLAIGDKLGGHLVTGHVDGGRGRFTACRRWCSACPGLAKYRPPRARSVDGVSLTVNRVEGSAFEVNLIPHTLEVTTLSRLQAGVPVNVEVDLLARYVERL